MEIVIEMIPEHYDAFVAQCDIASREYAILKNGVVVRDQKSGEQRVIGILCDKVEAARLLYRNPALSRSRPCHRIGDRSRARTVSRSAHFSFLLAKLAA